MEDKRRKAVLISCFGWYERRLKPIAEVLSSNYEVQVLQSDFSHTLKEKIEHRSDECEYISVPEYRHNLSLRRILSHFVFGWKIYNRVREIQPDFIYVTVPPNCVASFCYKYIKKNPSTKYYVDVIDLWPESLPKAILKDSLIGQWWKCLRNESLSAANGIITECNYYQKVLKEEGIANEQMQVLSLYKTQDYEHQKRIKEIIDTRGNNENTVILGYLGSINHIIDIDKIINVIKGYIYQGFTVELRIIGAGESKEELIIAAERVGALVKDYGIVYDENIKIEILTPCDFGLNLMKDTVAVGMTTKSIDYLSYGLPLINNIKGDTWELVETEKVGWNVADEATYRQAHNRLRFGKDYRFKVLAVFNNKFSKKQYKNTIEKVFNT